MVASRFTLPANVSAHALELLVVLELDGVQPGELDRDRRGARDAGRRVVVGDVHLLHVAAGDHVALRGAAVTGHHHTAGILQRDDRGAVRQRASDRDGAASTGSRADSSGAWRRSSSEKDDRSTGTETVLR